MKQAVRILAAVSIVAISSGAMAQDYPGNKPVRFIVSMPAGGGTGMGAVVRNAGLRLN